MSFMYFRYLSVPNPAVDSLLPSSPLENHVCCFLDSLLFWLMLVKPDVVLPLCFTHCSMSSLNPCVMVPPYVQWCYFVFTSWHHFLYYSQWLLGVGLLWLSVLFSCVLMLPLLLSLCCSSHSSSVWPHQYSDCNGKLVSWSVVCIFVIFSWEQLALLPWPLQVACDWPAWPQKVLGL